MTEPSPVLDIVALLKKHAGRNYELHAEHVNPANARTLKTIGFDRCYVRAEGPYLWDIAGQKYLDLLSGYGVFSLGRNHPDVRRVWLLNCYHSEDADLMMLLLGKNMAALTGYVMSWVRTTPGVIDTEMGTVMDWRWLASPEDIVELCEMFFTDSRATR
mgnify:CR=1 FL=1